MQVNVGALSDRYGLERLGFLTLTFADHVLCPKEAGRRFNSLASNVLRVRYPDGYIRIIERQKSGRIHFHLLVALPEGTDIRTGCDFDAFERLEYGSAPPKLRAEWAFWRTAAKQYRFGRTELLPVKSSSQAVGRYLGKYIAKHMEAREDRDKGIRLVSYSGERVANAQFAWSGGRAKDWRKKLGAFVQVMHQSGVITSPTIRGMKLAFGPRWCWKWRESIAAMPLEA